LPVVHSFHSGVALAGAVEDGGAVVLISLREKLIKIGAKVESHGRDTDQVIFTKTAV
jgi:hypothetical protein